MHSPSHLFLVLVGETDEHIGNRSGAQRRMVSV